MMSERRIPPADKPLWRRLLLFIEGRRSLLLAWFALLALGAGLQTAAPLIVKTIIDRHLVAIGLPWYRGPVSAVPPGVKFIAFDGQAYVREDWLPPDRGTGDGQPTLAGIRAVGGNLPALATDAAAGEKLHLQAQSESTDANLTNRAQAAATDATAPVQPGTHAIDVNPPMQARDDAMSGELRDRWMRVTIDTGTGGASLQGESGPARPLSLAEVKLFYAHDLAPTLLWTAALLGLLLGSAALTVTVKYALQNVGLQAIKAIRMQAMRHLHRVPISYFDAQSSGQIATRVMNDTDAIYGFFVTLFPSILVSAATIAWSLLLMYQLHWTLATAALAVLPVVVWLSRFYFARSRPLLEAIRAKTGDLQSFLNECIQLMPIIQTYRQEQPVLAEFESHNERLYDRQLRHNRLTFLFSGNLLHLLERLVPAVVVWFFLSAPDRSAFSLGTLVVFIEFMVQIIQQASSIFDQAVKAQQHLVAARRVFELLDVEPEPNPAAGSHPQRLHGPLRFEHVSFGYPGSSDVLKNVTFEVAPGETLAIVGRSGSGKSTLVQLLYGFYRPQAGEIRLDDKPLSSISLSRLRRRIGAVFQDPVLFAGDVGFNVSLYRDMDADRVGSLLSELGLDGLWLRPPGETLPEEDHRRWSAGQKQLIALARALANEPDLLILDEATSNLDGETERIIQQKVKRSAKGRTTLMIAHRLSTIRDADRIIVLHDGQVAEQGTHEQLIARAGMYYRMYRLQEGRDDNLPE